MGRGDRRSIRCPTGPAGVGVFGCLRGDVARNRAARADARAAKGRDVDASRGEDRKALERVPGDEAARFRRENPDADIYDWERRKGGGG